MRNPFTPTFGATPPLLVGRSGLAEDFREGLQEGVGAAERSTIVTGLRGSGKTVMLNAYEDVAKREGWLVISETTSPGLVQRLAEYHLPALLHEHDPVQTESRITGLTGPGGWGGQRQVTDLHLAQPTFRSRLERLADVLPADSGVLLSIDEVHREAVEDLRALGATVQHAIREGRNVAFVGAGLPSSISNLLTDKVSTFLRRSDRRHLGKVSSNEVRQALEVPIRDAGWDVSASALDEAVEGTRGYPFLIQLVGRQMWRAARNTPRIESKHARQGVEAATRKIGELVHAPALADLSSRDRSFLAAMSQDDDASRMGDIARRLGVNPAYAGQYRLRLIAAEMIEPVGHGLVDYTLPYLRPYLRDHVAGTAWFPRARPGSADADA